jgi:hypothetical protein
VGYILIVKQKVVLFPIFKKNGWVVAVNAISGASSWDVEGT